MWNQTCPPEHMNLPNEDIHVRVAEHENVEANTEYDPDCCIRNDLDENEIERGNDLECGMLTLYLITTMKQT